MIYYEVEDMNDGHKCLFHAHTKAEIEKQLEANGFTRMMEDCWVRMFAGHEVSAMPWRPVSNSPEKLKDWLKFLRRRLEREGASDEG